MKPGLYNLELTENAVNIFSFSISGITTATNYSAKIDIRTTDLPTSTLLLALSSPSSGIALTSNGSSLIVTITITEAQTDTLLPLVVATDGTASWSLKITDPSSVTLQYLLGLVVPTRTPST